MDKRAKQKEETYHKLMDQSTLLVQKKGFVQVSTKDIAEACCVSQGTIFVHFASKNELLHQVLLDGVEQVRNALTKTLRPDLDRERFPRELLSIWIQHEPMLARVHMDYTYLPDALKREVDDLDSVIKNLIFDHLKEQWSTRINILDSFLLIDAFLSQIKAYWMERNPMSVQLVLKQRQGRILKLYRMLFSASS